MPTFAQLHRPGDPLFLPNAWDHASGAALAARLSALPVHVTIDAEQGVSEDPGEVAG